MPIRISVGVMPTTFCPSVEHLALPPPLVPDVPDVLPEPAVPDELEVPELPDVPDELDEPPVPPGTTPEPLVEVSIGPVVAPIPVPPPVMSAVLPASLPVIANLSWESRVDDHQYSKTGTPAAGG